MKKNNILLFDVGGTWTKMAVAEDNKIISKKILLTDKFKLEDIKSIIEDMGLNFSLIVIACAGPVKDGKCKMTNANHVFDEKSLTNMLKIKVVVINDLEAVAYGLKSKYDSSLIIEIGTGLGVSLISDKRKVIPSEEGHYLIEKELFLSVPELRNTIIPEYEYLLSGKNNILIKLFNKSFVNLDEEIVKNEKGAERTFIGKLIGKKDKKNNENILLKKNRFTELYLQILNAFIYKMLSAHKSENIKRIIFTGGVVSGNEVFMKKFISELKKRLAKDKMGIKEIEIIDDEFLGINGTLAFYKEKEENKIKN